MEKYLRRNAAVVSDWQNGPLMLQFEILCQQPLYTLHLQNNQRKDKRDDEVILTHCHHRS